MKLSHLYCLSNFSKSDEKKDSKSKNSKLGASIKKLFKKKDGQTMFEKSRMRESVKSDRNFEKRFSQMKKETKQTSETPKEPSVEAERECLSRAENLSEVNRVVNEKPVAENRESATEAGCQEGNPAHDSCLDKEKKGEETLPNEQLEKSIQSIDQKTDNSKENASCKNMTQEMEEPKEKFISHIPEPKIDTFSLSRVSEKDTKKSETRIPRKSGIKPPSKIVVQRSTTRSDSESKSSERQPSSSLPRIVNGPDSMPRKKTVDKSPHQGYKYSNSKIPKTPNMIPKRESNIPVLNIVKPSHIRPGNQFAHKQAIFAMK